MALGRISFVFTAFLAVSGAHALEADAPVLISRTPAGDPTNGYCHGPRLSNSGRFLTFTCESLDVVPGERGIGDAMLHDAVTHSITGLSLNDENEWISCGGAERGTCSSYAIGALGDGDRIVLNSGAPLTADSPPPTPDFGFPNVFLRDVADRTTRWLTPPPPGETQNGGPQGQDADPVRNELLFTTSTNYAGGLDSNGPISDLYLTNWATGAVELISASPSGEQGDGHTTLGRFSPDRRYVVLLSSANNLTGDNPLHHFNLFLRDRELRTTRRLSFPWQGGEFTSPPVFMSSPQITIDNRHLVFSASGARFTADDDPDSINVYDIDLGTGATELISRGVDGAPLNAPAASSVVSSDGRFLAFYSAATNVMADAGPLPAIFVQDRRTGSVVNVSAQLGAGSTTLGTWPPTLALSADGSTVAFDWSTYDATFPTLAIDEQIFRVALRTEGPAAAVPVPASTDAGRLGLGLAIACAAAVARRRRRLSMLRSASCPKRWSISKHVHE
jgi:Tol biopolymer transport system component